MIKIFKLAIFVVIILVAVGCEVEIAAPMDPAPGRPTVPLKRRPIVPTSKLPRPRVAGEEFAAIEVEAYEAAEWDYCEEW
jgi:hypothetical protein